ncbi:MAG TPA: protein kinase, partial [Thermoanaerobaculia bacterium]|nr:protein kinase [Thermoanaerobaculia bacterium]
MQIAQALEEAHEKGIIHRDLKPQNVKASIEGKVKVLDFGLAKAMDPAAGAAASAADMARSPTLMQSPTLTAVHGTQLGVILGTAAYMAPEQARGAAIDKRADIWAFGVVLYEMLSGRSLFVADTVSDTLAGVLRADIDFAALPAGVPSAIRRLLGRCLDRNPKNRLHDIADARIVIEEVLTGKLVDLPAAPSSSATQRRGPSWLATGVIAAGCALLGLGVARWLVGSSTGAPAPARAQFEIHAPEKTSLVSGLALSADGRTLAFVARGADGRAALWIRPLDSLEARVLPGTVDARYPFWAPDGKRIGFFAQGKLKVTDLQSGSPRIVAPTGPTTEVRGASWGGGDVILFTPTFTGPIFSVPAGGGAVAAATRLPGDGGVGTQRFPSFLPDGQRFAFYASAGTGNEPGALYVGRLGSLDSKRLGPSTSMAVYAEPGYLLYLQGEALVAHRFDDRREELLGDPQPLGIQMPGGISVSGQRSLAVAGDGVLIHRADRRGVTRLSLVDRGGHEIAAISHDEDTWYFNPRLSPDGKRLVADHYDAGSPSADLWIHDLERGLASRLTFDAGDDSTALWSSDGKQIAFTSVRTGSPSGIYLVDPERPGEERLWLPGDAVQWPNCWTPDGKRLIFQRADSAGRVGLWIRDLDGANQEISLSAATASESSADLSPDARWLAYASDQTGISEVYLRRLDGSGGALRVSSAGGSQPRWRDDGRELFYVDGGGRLFAVPLGSLAPLTPGAPAPLFDAQLEDGQFDVTADGQRFVVN